MKKQYNHPWIFITCLLLACIASSAQAEATVIKTIAIEGLERTQERVVLRQLPFTAGNVWQSHFAEQGERWLRNLGLFSEVHIYAPDDNGTVRVQLRERWSLWILPQFSRHDNGASSAGIALDEYNMWGLNHHLRLAYRRDTGKNFSTLNGSSYEASYLWSRIRDSRLSMGLAAGKGTSIFDTYQNGQLVSEYLQNGKSGSVSLGYALGPVPGEGWDASFGFALNHTAFRLLSGPPQADVIGTRKHSLLAGVHYRQIDDQIIWLSGTAFDYTLDVAHQALGSTINVYRQTLSIRSYIPIHEQQNTLNLRANAGLASGDVLRDGLFDLGNRDNIRGYYPGEIQGKAYLYGTIEGRFLLYPDSNVQVVTFSDAGYIPGTSHSVQGKKTFFGLGAGLRWTLRWLVRGTIRGDAAYGIATKRWRFYLGTGQTF